MHKVNHQREWAVLIFAMIFPSCIAWLYFVQFANQGEGPNPVAQAIAVLGKSIQFLLPVGYLWLVDRRALRWINPDGRGMWFGIGFAFLTIAAMMVLYHGFLRGTSLLEGVDQEVYAKLRELNCDSPLRFVLLAAFICIVHAFMEEYYFRWFLFDRLSGLIPLWPAILLSSLAFMAHHIITLGVFFPGRFWTLAIPFSLAVAIGGAVWAWLYYHSRSLYAIWLSHLLVDAGIMLIGWDMVQPYWYR